MTDDERQLNLLGGKPDLHVEIPAGTLDRMRDARHALEYCFNLSSLTPKQVYRSLGIAQATFSKIMGGGSSAFMDPNHRVPFMRICGNDLPLRYEAAQMGYDLVPKRTPVERQLEEAHDEIRDLNKKLELMADLLRANR